MLLPYDSNKLAVAHKQLITLNQRSSRHDSTTPLDKSPMLLPVFFLPHRLNATETLAYEPFGFLPTDWLATNYWHPAHLDESFVD